MALGQHSRSPARAATRYRWPSAAASSSSAGTRPMPPTRSGPTTRSATTAAKRSCRRLWSATFLGVLGPRPPSTASVCARTPTSGAESSTTPMVTRGQEPASTSLRYGPDGNGPGPALDGDRLQRHPVFFRPATGRRPADGFEGGTDVALAVAEDTRGQNVTARGEFIAKRPRQQHQERRDQVGEDDVEGALAGRRAALTNAQSARLAVEAGVGNRRLYGDRVRVHPEHLARAELSGGDGQDAGAAANIDDTGCAVARPAAREQPLFGEGLKSGQA